MINFEINLTFLIKPFFLYDQVRYWWKKESCDLIEQEHILVNLLKVDVMHNKDTFPPQNSINLSFWITSNVAIQTLKRISQTPRQIKPIPGKSRHVWAWQSTSRNSLTWCLSLVTISMQINTTFAVSFRRYWWSQNPVILMGDTTIWSITWS